MNHAEISINTLTVEVGSPVNRIKEFERGDISPSNVYMFEGGMAREHRTAQTEQLTHKIRLSCLFGSRVLMHAGNVFEEPAMFAALKLDSELLERGHILPVIRKNAGSLEDYGAKWYEKYRSGDPSNLAFYQGRKITAKGAAEVEERVEYFRSARYSVLRLDSIDKSAFRDHFIASVDRILADEPTLTLEIKEAIRERARSHSSPLGKIRHEVLQELWRTGMGTAPAARRVNKRINIAFYGAGARELNTWFTMSEPAFRDLRHAPASMHTSVSDLVELSVSRALGISGESLVQIQSEDFADIVESVAAARFRSELEKSMSTLNLYIFGGISKHDLVENRLNLQQEVDQNLRDTYASSLERAIRRRRRREDRWVKWGIGGSLVGLGVATDFMTGGLNTSLPIGTTIGTALSAAANAAVKPRMAPIVMLQEKLQSAADKR